MTKQTRPMGEPWIRANTAPDTRDAEIERLSAALDEALTVAGDNLAECERLATALTNARAERDAARAALTEVANDLAEMAEEGSSYAAEVLARIRVQDYQDGAGE